MLTNLFSSFDPSTTLLFQFNWIMLMLTMLMLPNKFWFSESRNSMIKNLLKNFMEKEMKFIFFNNQFINNMKTMFIFILIMNMSGLTPYVFTPSSHLSISLALGLPIWFSLMTFSWTKFTNLMFAHLLPLNTPTPIAPFMILVESLSNLIRPVSLSVRLTANMIAGHLLMTLLGNINSISSITLIITLQIAIMLFEMTVALIQAYVFTILMTMYSSEIP
uniref:ATP synthase subunit a n=1 Tax=Laodelphax striatellus TaxID=195883 RepID=D2D0K2_LAOST|nr:ATP synthase F0 subunit 6 [Laodelphax striatellus]ACI95043.1 ATP synthase F0 subunit 6 [Laodelphax striatellus]AGC22515.1 ATP synthase F0 subunit 6 [Laodelphax striatellus]ATV98847.1 ATP synthase F0 subunit 6 [Laodelphax striatellus]QCS25243.1 ATP synthase F0 subunit 6 [Laodelphax striatellus]QCS26351.1 ATP synthase F0 subunit 6 [Laodelphax striatellus]